MEGRKGRLLVESRAAKQWWHWKAPGFLHEKHKERKEVGEPQWHVSIEGECRMGQVETEQGTSGKNGVGEYRNGGRVRALAKGALVEARR